jgi:hypothetical protein
MALDTIPKQEGGKLKAVASGTLPSGQPVIVNADGTVSTITGASGDLNVGSETYIGASQNDTTVVYDSNSQKIVYIYKDDANVGRATAVVGTVSGSSITFGTPVVASSGTASGWISACFDPDTNQVVIAFADGSNNGKGTAVVGSVSGASISFGSNTVFETGLILYTATVYDTVNNKVVISYKDQTNSNYGTAVVGTVSGTSISFGTPVVFDSLEANRVMSAFDPVAGKVGVFWEGYTPSFSDAGKAVVGTVSGTSISFGAINTYTDTTGGFWPVAGYDASAGSFVVIWRNNVPNAYAIAAQISGTSLTFGSAVQIGTSTFGSSRGAFAYDANAEKSSFIYSQGGTPQWGVAKVSGTAIDSFDVTPISGIGTFRWGGVAYDANTKKNAVVICDTNNSEGGSYYVIQNAFSSTNLTSENYIGISAGGAVADGGNANVGIVGSVSDEQSGLTAGQQYYVQADGTLSETPADPSVLAGTAISATKMLVKT